MIHNIQALRGIAAAAVALYHAVPHYRAMGGSSEVYPLIAGFGYIGVDMFFIISGYVMALTTINKPRDGRNAIAFLQKRLFRIYLGYWPFFLMMLLIIGYYRPTKLDDYDLIASFFLTSAAKDVLLLHVSWSLTYELFFYSLIFALFAFKLNNANRILGAIFLLILTANLFWHVVSHPVNRFFLSPYILGYIRISPARKYGTEAISWGLRSDSQCS